MMLSRLSSAAEFGVAKLLNHMLQRLIGVWACGPTKTTRVNQDDCACVMMGKLNGLARITQTGGNPIDNVRHDAVQFFPFSNIRIFHRAHAAQQLHLQIVQRIHVGIAQLD